jgi:hypothetical protein
MKARFKLGMLVALLAISHWVSAQQAQSQSLLALRVFAVPATNDVRVREPFKMALRVENPTGTNQTIGVMSCSWEQEWQCSNPNVTFDGWACTMNFSREVVIPPGGAYTNEGTMLIHNLISGKEISFRMGFTSMGSTQTFWSGEIKLRVLPPDTWGRGGQFYRDRNQDGKIDWEVSGETWMGHVVGLPKNVTSYGNGMVIQEMAGQGVDTYKVDTNFDGFYDLTYGAGGTNGQVQWSKPIHERVPALDRDFVPRQREAWMDWWKG